MESLHTFFRHMAICEGFGFLLSRLVASRSVLVHLNARSCIASGMSADLSRMFKFTAIAASFTGLGGGGLTMGGTGGRHCTLSLFFAILHLLPISDCGLSMESSLDRVANVSGGEREREGVSE